MNGGGEYNINGSELDAYVANLQERLWAELLTDVPDDQKAQVRAGAPQIKLPKRTPVRSSGAYKLFCCMVRSTVSHCASKIHLRRHAGSPLESRTLVQRVNKIVGECYRNIGNKGFTFLIPLGNRKSTGRTVKTEHDGEYMAV